MTEYTIHTYQPLCITALFTEYAEWLKTAKPNDKFVYYKGNSPADSLNGIKLASIVSEDAKAGKVYLIRKKIRDFHFHFMAVKASTKPNSKLIPFSEYRSKRS